MKPYEVFEHTADVGLKIRGRTLEDLFKNGALALIALMTDPDQVFKENDRLLVGFDLKASSLDELFLKWLREILFNFSAKRLALDGFKFDSLSDTELSVRAGGVPFDPDIHEQRCEVKAVTCHHFKLEKKNSVWQAEVIADI